MDFDDKESLVEAALESVVVTRQFGDLLHLIAIGRRLGTALLRRQRALLGRLALLSPGVQAGGIDGLPTQHRTDLAGSSATVDLPQNAQLLGKRKQPPPGLSHHFCVGGDRKIFRSRSRRICSRPAGSFRCACFGKNLRFSQCRFDLSIDCHRYLVAH